MTVHVQKTGAPWIAAVTAAVVTASGGPGAAADRALLVAAGGYRSPIPSLPGTSQDLAAMTDIAHGLGFANEAIRVLSGPQATRAAITEALETWLVKDVGPGDRALFYYSGHGTRVKDESGDEADGLDEALVPADVVKEGGAWKGLLLDDDLGAVLGRIGGRAVLAFVDACHSGTLARGVDEGGSVAKFVELETAPSKTGREAALLVDPAPRALLDARFVIVSAADARQAARATAEGSVFTAGVRDAVNAARQSGRALSPAEIRDAAQDHIARHFAQRPALAHTPTVDGNPALAARDWLATTTRARRLGGAASAWARLETLARGAAYGIAVRPPRAVQRRGESFSLRIDVPKDGYLTVAAAGAGDKEPVLLFPSGKGSGAVKAGDQIEVPDPKGEVALRATLPPGEREQPTLLLATLSPAPPGVDRLAPRAPGAEPYGAGVAVVVVKE